MVGVSGLDVVPSSLPRTDGVKPQTREHLAICSLLGMQTGIVVLSKADLVEPELRRSRPRKCEFLEGTFSSTHR
jgi:selenocysteine-specific elongation factor